MRLNFDKQLILNLLHKLFEQNKSSLIVEGGAKLLNSFIAMDLWDEARVFISDRFLNQGIPAPTLPVPPLASYNVGNDQLFWFKKAQ